jgi:hypothetical protein
MADSDARRASFVFAHDALAHRRASTLARMAGDDASAAGHKRGESNCVRAALYWRKLHFARTGGVQA